MYIERIQIEEGFLNGFDVCLRAGLNVLIGARGTGKTSPHCLA
jgi:predicted ATP-dependent endonuclease of OLD family